MSLEAFGDGGGSDYVSGERFDEAMEEAFIRGAQAMREQLARFVEQGGDATIARSMRLNWVPSWGDDPGAWQGDMPRDAGL